jgi:hypothetical protein
MKIANDNDGDNDKDDGDVKEDEYIHQHVLQRVKEEE